MRRLLHRLAAFAALVACATVARAQLIDDFESYADTPALQTAWSFGTLDDSTPNHAAGSRSLRRSGTVPPLSGLIVFHDFAAPLDMTSERVSVWVRRDPASLVPTSANLGLSDGTSSYCSPPSTDFTDTAWHRIVFDVAAPSGGCDGIDLTHVTRVLLFIDNVTGSGGLIAANFDDLEHYFFRSDFEDGTSGWSVSSGLTFSLDDAGAAEAPSKPE